MRGGGGTPPVDGGKLDTKLSSPTVPPVITDTGEPMGIFAPENGPCSSDSPVPVSVIVVVAPVAALITRPMSSSSAMRVSSVASVVVLGTDLRPPLLCFPETSLVVVRRLHFRVVHP